MSEANISRRGFLGHVGGAYTAIALGAGATVAIQDPMLVLINRWNGLSQQMPSVPDDEADAFYESFLAPIETEMAYGTPPAATSAEGAAAALRKVLWFADVEGQDANLIRSALAYLESRTA